MEILYIILFILFAFGIVLFLKSGLFKCGCSKAKVGGEEDDPLDKLDDLMRRFETNHSELIR